MSDVSMTQDAYVGTSAETRPSIGVRAWHHIPHGARWAVIVLAIMVLVALCAPWIAPYAPTAQIDPLHLSEQPPSWAHLFGTDSYSRDVFSRAVYGARISLTVAGVATFVMMTIGTAVGAVAGYAGGWIDDVLMRVVDALMAIPRILLLIVVVALWQGLPVWVLILVIGLTGWFNLSRLVRGQVLTLRQEEYVLAAESLGAGRLRLVVRHILPNVWPTILAAASLELGTVIVLEAGLSYLGLGIQPPAASWGNLIYDGAGAIQKLWWLSVFPGALIALTAVAASVIGDRLRERLDPRTVVP
jgi:peptide/nickel transport system permease protein